MHRRRSYDWRSHNGKYVLGAEEWERHVSSFLPDVFPPLLPTEGSRAGAPSGFSVHPVQQSYEPHR